MKIASRVDSVPLARTGELDRRRPAAGFAALLESTTGAANPKAGAAETKATATSAVPVKAATTATGAPQVTIRESPVANPWNYAGPAARNPFYCTPENPMREGAVSGFDKWFEPVQVVPAAATGGGYTMNRAYGLTAEGAQEALRLIQQYVPGARLETDSLGIGWVTDKPVYQVVLPNETRMAAGLVLDRYYNKGQGVTAASDIELASELRLLTSA